MKKPLARGEIGYRGSDDVELRFALYQVWKSRCHICDEPQLFEDTQIDHIIHDTVSAARLQELIPLHGLPNNFHLHRPPNLALACGPCNGRKSDRAGLLHTGKTGIVLDQARQHAPEVERLIRSRKTAGVVSRGLIQAITAGVRDPSIRRSLLTHGPLLVQALALLDEGKATGFTTTRHLHLSDGQYVRVLLDACGRTALGIIEGICASSLDAALEAGIPHLKIAIDRRVADHFGLSRGEPGDRRVTTDPVEVAIGHLEVSRRGTIIEVECLGRVSAETCVTIAQTSTKSEPTETVRFAAVEGTFELMVGWDLSVHTTAPGEVGVRSPGLKIDEFHLGDD
jgi:hypothetical protein